MDLKEFYYQNIKESEYHLGKERPLESTTRGPSSTMFVGSSNGKLCIHKQVFLEA